MTRAEPFAVACAIMWLSTCSSTDETLPTPARNLRQRAAERGAAAPAIRDLHRIVLEYAVRRPAPVSGIVPARICVDVSTLDPPLPEFPTVTDVQWVRDRGLPVVGGNLDCFHASEPPAAYMSPCAPERWFSDPDEYEVAVVVMYRTGVVADEDVRLLVVIAVRKDSAWHVKRHEVQELPASAYALGRRTKELKLTKPGNYGASQLNSSVGPT